MKRYYEESKVEFQEMLTNVMAIPKYKISSVCSLKATYRDSERYKGLVEVMEKDGYTFLRMGELARKIKKQDLSRIFREKKCDYHGNTKVIANLSKIKNELLRSEGKKEIQGIISGEISGLGSILELIN